MVQMYIRLGHDHHTNDDKHRQVIFFLFTHLDQHCLVFNYQETCRLVRRRPPSTGCLSLYGRHYFWSLQFLTSRGIKTYNSIYQRIQFFKSLLSQIFYSTIWPVYIYITDINHCLFMNNLIYSYINTLNRNNLLKCIGLIMMLLIP